MCVRWSRRPRTFGKLHIVVNNAGIGDFGKRLHEIDDATWANVLDINLTGVFRMTRAAIQLIKNGGGSIVNISTVASLVGLRGLSAYARVKGRAGCADPVPWPSTMHARQHSV